MPDHPLNEYHTSERKGTSGCEYQIDVSTAMPGVTIASMVPKKNLDGKSQHYDTEVKSVRFGAPVDHSPCEVRARRGPECRRIVSAGRYRQWQYVT